MIDGSFKWTEDGKPICPNCGKVMQNATDTITAKKSSYLWKCSCTHVQICMMKPKEVM